MNRNLSPKSVRMAMEGSVDRAVFRDLHGAVERDVMWVVFRDVYRAVWWAVEDAVFGDVAVQNHPSHPNLDRLLAEIR